MGQKVNPIGLRLGIVTTWQSRWYAEKDKYTNYLLEDLKIRRYIKERFYRSGVSKVEIERLANQIKVIIKTARPGIVIGRKGSEVEKLRQELQKLTGNPNIQISVEEVPIPEIDAQLVAENIAAQIERRVSYRRAMKQAIARALKMGAKGIKIACAGRLAGAEIAREEWYREGRLPLQTLRADIDYGFAEALTTYGKIGVKVWIFKGEVISPGEILEEEVVALPKEEGYEEELEDYVDAQES
ncbi:MAG: 30S ribosomal protein S3 [Candidatus Caldatribacterium sp.]|uniref:30S ribosomal protein S3 n=1 Tax=Candidatus Caldatribacterium sp. TaxID=2282143 RepID=UPI002994AF21|nr:30S ribosomal protein S3 [Candidatus Caldatribacterium sp.]MCX7731207.1 30S ribosomal protein S3 [Candidatus Caldatribacterium sp.]MDW8082088.1 30S ribosomal protein S3 [Candidatus Calescibacterium sp.]